VGSRNGTWTSWRIGSCYDVAAKPGFPVEPLSLAHMVAGFREAHPQLPRSRVVVTSSETIKNHKVTATMPNTGPENGLQREVEVVSPELSHGQ